MNEIIKHQAQFEGQALTIFNFRRRPCMIASHAGRALTYADDGRNLVEVITKQWADEMILGRDYDVLTGSDLRDFKAIMALTEETSVSPNTPNLMILYESGWNLVCIKTEKPTGRRLRRFLADEVMPALQRGTMPTISPSTDPRVAVLDLARAAAQEGRQRDAKVLADCAARLCAKPRGGHWTRPSDAPALPPAPPLSPEEVLRRKREGGKLGGRPPAESAIPRDELLAAVGAVGGRRAACERFGIPAGSLSHYLSGRSPVPKEVADRVRMQTKN